MGASTPKPPKFHPAQYTPLDPGSLQSTSVGDANALATQYDSASYAASDADYKARHPDLVAANQLAEQNALAMQRGEVPAGLSAELTRDGLASANAALTANLVPGSSGAFGLARGLGVDYGQYVNQANQNVAQLDALNPQRSFGLTGSQALNLQLSNQQQQNSVLVGNQQGAQQVAIANATGQNSSNQGGFAGALQAYAAQSAGRNTAIQTGVGLAASGLGSYFNYSNGVSAGTAAANGQNAVNIANGYG